MSSSGLSIGQRPSVPGSYRFFRGLVRIGLRLRFPKLRPLRAETLPDSGAAVLVVSRPSSFLQALILVAALERQVRCLVSERSPAGVLRRLFARGLGMISYEAETDPQPLIPIASQLLAGGQAIVLFCEEQKEEDAKKSSPASLAAAVALEARSQRADRFELSIFPVHMFVPVRGSHASEALVYLDTPLPPLEERAPARAASSVQARALTRELEKRLRENPFRLRTEQFNQFLAEFGEVLRADLEEEWASRPNWKQKVEGFELSGFVAERVEKLNELHPERLTALQESLSACREAWRLWNLRQLKSETVGTSLTSIGRRWWNRIEAPRLQRMRKTLIEQLNEGLEFQSETITTAR